MPETSRPASGSLPAARRGGRPTRDASEKLRDHILEVATELMLAQGYGATSIDEISRQARISKRTFYHRFQNKQDLMVAVVMRFIDSLRPAGELSLVQEKPLEEQLTHLAQVFLHAALTPRALKLFRLVMAEAERFPELAVAVNQAGGRQEAEALISAMLAPHTVAGKEDCRFAAAHFLQMVVTQPRLRALGLGVPLTPAELESWPSRTVSLFLGGFSKLKNDNKEITS